MTTDTPSIGETPARPSARAASRRGFLAKLSIAVGALGAAAVGAPVVGFLIAPLLRQTPELWRPVGPTDRFKVGETTLVRFTDPSPLPWAGVTANTAAWLRRESELQFIAFAVNCTHLGCPVRWLADAQLFMCPCHGGVFYGDGSVAAGPPPRPLTRYDVRVRAGQVEIHAGRVPIGAAQEQKQ
jgi:menaquinol-cytochrome c reductase iron-sulfur subunit